jgi:hypothetical protein
MSSLPPGKYYWPGAESHEAYTDKPIIITSSTNKKIHPPTQLITGSESHSDEPINEKVSCGCGKQHTKKYPI